MYGGAAVERWIKTEAQRQDKMAADSVNQKYRTKICAISDITLGFRRISMW